MKHENSGRRNVVQDKSFAFAIRIIQLSRTLRVNSKELVLSNQLLRSGTSIGANIEEAIAAQSKRDFPAKMPIALKEARETHYWLRLIYESDVLKDATMATLIKECRELLNLLNSITRTTRERLTQSESIPAKLTRHSSLHIPHSTPSDRRLP